MSIAELEKLTRPTERIYHARDISVRDRTGSWHRECTCGASWYGSGPDTFAQRENHLVEAGVAAVGDLAGLALI